MQKVASKADRFKNLGTAERTYCADTHFAHYLQKTLVDSLDVVVFGGGVVELHFVAFYKVVDNGKRHVGVDCACTKTEKKCGVHYLADFARLYNQSRLNAFFDRNKVMVNGANSQQRRNGGVVFVDATVGKNNIVNALVYRFFGGFAKVVDSLAHTLCAFFDFKQDGQFFGVESFVTNVAEGF